MNLQQWFDHYSSLLADQLDAAGKYKIHGASPDQFILPADHKDIPKWWRDKFSHFDICYITVRPGEEANYIVFLTDGMEKFHETYLAE
jgi:hypothetical protein